ncbi:hypothetical protein ABNO74_09830, partial [Campylobacter jejuni]
MKFINNSIIDCSCSEKMIFSISLFGCFKLLFVLKNIFFLPENNDYKFIEEEKADDSFLKEIIQKNPNSLEYENVLKSLVKNL